MIKQDYIIRMIQEIISAIAEVLLKRKKLNINDMNEYNNIAKQVLGMNFSELSATDSKEIIDTYSGNDEGTDKIELIAVSMLLMSEEENNDMLLKSRLKQSGAELLKHVKQNSNNFSLQREALIKLININN